MSNFLQTTKTKYEIVADYDNASMKVHQDDAPRVKLLKYAAQWSQNGGSDHGVDAHISDLLREHPEADKHIDKGIRHKTLWRGLGLLEKEMKRFLSTKTLAPRKYFESWSVKKDVAEGFAIPDWFCAGMYGVVFKKNIPKEDRLVYLPYYRIHVTEHEVLCYGRKLSLKDVSHILMKDPQTCKSKKFSLEQVVEMVSRGEGDKIYKLNNCC